MRKRIIGQAGEVDQPHSEERWLDLESIAEVEMTSEDRAFSIESALTLERKGPGWQAAQPGEQLLRILFEAPIKLHQIRLEFVENQVPRTQEFVLRWAGSRDEPMREIVRQQWVFSPDGSTSEIENYQVNLANVSVLELAIKPDISGGSAVAKLAAWRLA
jgi:hypothetical protein